MKTSKVMLMYLIHDTFCLLFSFTIFFYPQKIMETWMRKKIVDIVAHIISVLFF